uniref:Uncharacterized protein n=1 Tax=Tanacetum cinerariifolium TaxID=118510 RepID=A0A6L2KH46_TANCI|nr:hypothetical protein [Tanacetum cinerariifolium]
MTISFRSLKKSVVNITNSSTNKAFQVPVDPSRLQSPFNSRYELLAPCHVLLSPEWRIHTRIESLDLEFLDSVCQCFQNPSCSISSWFSEIHLCLLAFNTELKNQEDDRDDLVKGVDSGLQSYCDTATRATISQVLQVFIEEKLRLNSNMTWRTTERQWSVDIDSDLISYWIRPVNLICEHLVTLFHLELKYQFRKFVISLVFTSRMVQADLGVAGLSSSGSSFHQSFLESAFDPDVLVDRGGGGGRGNREDPNAPEVPGAPYAPTERDRGGGCDGGDPKGVIGRSLKRARSGACIAQSTASVTISSTALLTSKFAICCSSSSMRFTRIGSAVLCCGGGGRDIVVVIIEVFDVNVGRGEPDCDVVRSIIGVVIGGTDEVS